MPSCVFCEIIAGRSPASVVHRGDRCIAFMDLVPVTPGHLLVVPIAHASNLTELDPATGEALFSTAQRLADAVRRSGLKSEGINLFLADGVAAGQQVFHVHLHVLPRFPGDGFGLTFPPGYGRPVERNRLDEAAIAIANAARRESSP